MNPKIAPRRLSVGRVLPNGGVVLAYKNDPADPEMLAVVLVYLPNNAFHPFVVWDYNWSMERRFRTSHGDYHETITAAAAAFESRAKGGAS